MFIGEAPGADEDAQGVPFVGRAGQLLTRMIEDGMGLPRTSVYIANVLKCRPPDNRNPEPDEIASCRGYLEAQIDLVKPEVLVALGKFAAQFLLETEEGIMRLRGKWGAYRGIPVMPTFHPSFLLRQPGQKKDAWEDLLKVLAKVGPPGPAPKGSEGVTLRFRHVLGVAALAVLAAAAALVLTRRLPAPLASKRRPADAAGPHAGVPTPAERRAIDGRDRRRRGGSAEA